MQAVVRLTPEQKRALLQSRNRLLARMAGILQRRTEVGCHILCVSPFCMKIQHLYRSVLAVAAGLCGLGMF